MDVPTHMKAIRKVSPAPGAAGTRLEHVPVPAPRPGEVLLKVLATAMCGTDRHIYQWHPTVADIVAPPRTYGHEFCGVVADLGPAPGRADLGEGDYVSAEMHVVCDQCRPCLNGQRHACEQTRILGLHEDGCFAEYCCVPAANVVKLNPRDIPPQIGAFLDALGNAVHTIEYTPLQGQSVAVLGFGPIGAMAAAVARHERAAQIYILDVNPRAIERAEGWMKASGASNVRVVEITDPRGAIAEVQAMNGGGIDIVLEMSGAQSAVNSALALVRPGGHISLLGLPARPALTIDDYARDVIFKGVRMQAIIGRRMFETWERMLNLLSDGLDVSFVVSEEYPGLECFPEAMAAFEHGDAMKVVLYPHGRPA